MNERNPFRAYRWVEVPDGSENLIEQLPVLDLVQGAVNGTVEECDAGYGRRLFAELDRRGDSAWREAVLLFLDFLYGTTVNGMTGAEGASSLRHAAAAQTNPTARLMLDMLAEHRFGDVDAVVQLWDTAPAEQRGPVGRRLFLAACGDVNLAGVHLSKDQLQRLSGQLLG